MFSPSNSGCTLHFSKPNQICVSPLFQARDRKELNHNFFHYCRQRRLVGCPVVSSSSSLPSISFSASSATSASLSSSSSSISSFLSASSPSSSLCSLPASFALRLDDGGYISQTDSSSKFTYQLSEVIPCEIVLVVPPSPYVQYPVPHVIICFLFPNLNDLFDHFKKLHRKCIPA